MPQPLPEIDVGGSIRNALINQQIQQNLDVQNQNHLMRQNVGNALASGDWEGAQNIAAQGGDLDLYKQLHDQHMEAADKAHQVTSNLLQTVDTPEKWQMAINAARQSGMNVDKYAAIADKFGWETAKNIAAAETGQSADLLKQEQTRRESAWKQFAGALAATNGDEDTMLPIVKQARQNFGLDASQYLTPEGNLAQGAYETILGKGGYGKKAFNANAKADQAERKRQSSALGQATENVIQGAIKRYGIQREDIPQDLAQSAAAARGTLERTENGDWILRNPDGSMGAFRQQFLANQAKRYDPQTTAANAYAREGSKANVKLDVQMNRLASVKDQIQQLRDMAGEEGSPERDDFNSSIGWLTSHSGRQYWGSGNVPAIMSSLHSKVSTLQDELAQYVQASGASSDVRAKKAYDVVGDLQNSPDPQTFLKRLNSIEQTVESLRKVPHINAAGAGKQATAPSPPQASNAQLPKVGAIEDGYRFKGGDPSQASNWEPVR